MARVTIEDCVDKIGNHFRVVEVAAHRARHLDLGSSTKVEQEDDKSVVVALREISEGKVDEKVLDDPLPNKALWNKSLQPPMMGDDLEADIEQSLADVDNYSDINKVDAADGEQKVASDSATDTLLTELATLEQDAATSPPPQPSVAQSDEESAAP